MTGIPGLAVGPYPAAARPRDLLRPGSLLLAGPADLPDHRAFWGPVPVLRVESLIAATHPVVGAGGRSSRPPANCGRWLEPGSRRSWSTPWRANRPAPRTRCS